MPLTEQEALDFFLNGDNIDRRKAANILRSQYDWDVEQLLLYLQRETDNEPLHN